MKLHPFKLFVVLFAAVTGPVLSQAQPPSPGGDPDNGAVVFNLKLFVEGYYSGPGTMVPALFNNNVAGATNTMVDTVTVELHAPTGGLATVATAKGILLTNGSLPAITVTNGITAGNSYYVVVKHRNSVAVWSASPVVISAGITYDFSTAVNKAYGNNMKQSGSVCILYSGDVNRDGYVDAQDVGDTDNDNANFGSGILGTDVNGDGFVDAQDVGMTDNNNAGFVSVAYPSGYAGTGRVRQPQPGKKRPALRVAKAAHHSTPAYYTNLITNKP